MHSNLLKFKPDFPSMLAARNGQFPGRNKHNAAPMLPPFFFPPFGAPFFPNYPPGMLNPQNPSGNESNGSSVFPTMTPEMLMMQIMKPNLFCQNAAFPQMLANAAAFLERQKQNNAESTNVQSPTTSVGTPPSSQASDKADQPESEPNNSASSPTTSSHSTPQTTTKETPKPNGDEVKVTKKGGFGVSDLLNK